MTAEAQTVVDTVTRLGGRALLVGGFVRDQLIGAPNKDIDIEVHGKIVPARLEAELSKVGRVDSVGAAFGVLKFGADVDVSFPRRDSKTGAGHTGFDVKVDPNMSMEEAFSRRDFTMNAIGRDAVSGELVDPFHGVNDIRSGVIRHVSDDTFGDDPLRVLRAVQFAGRFGFKIAPETAAISRSIAGQLSGISKERLWMEWDKIYSKGKSMTAVTDAINTTGANVIFKDWAKGNASASEAALKTSLSRKLSQQNKAATITAAHFGRDQEAARNHLATIDAPIWLRTAVKSIQTTTGDVNTPAGLRQIARQLKVPLQDWLIANNADRGTWDRARRLGILNKAKPTILTGEHLKAKGMKPGPDFGRILKLAQQEQDRAGWTTEQQATRWLDDLSDN